MFFIFVIFPFIDLFDFSCLGSHGVISSSVEFVGDIVGADVGGSVVGNGHVGVDFDEKGAMRGAEVLADGHDGAQGASVGDVDGAVGVDGRDVAVGVDERGRERVGVGAGAAQGSAQNKKAFVSRNMPADFVSNTNSKGKAKPDFDARDQDRDERKVLHGDLSRGIADFVEDEKMRQTLLAKLMELANVDESAENPSRA